MNEVQGLPEAMECNTDNSRQHAGYYRSSVNFPKGWNRELVKTESNGHYWSNP